MQNGFGDWASDTVTHVVLLLADDFDRSAIFRSLARQYTVACCGSTSTLSEMINQGVNVIVYEPGLGLCDNAVILDEIGRCGARVILRTRLTVAAIEEVVTIAHRLPHAGVLLRAQNVRDEAMLPIDLLHEPDCGPAGLVLDRVAPALPANALLFVTAAIALGKVRSGLPTYAAACGMAVRTCQAAHQRYHLPSPKSLLRWGQAFWAVWRIGRWNMSCKQAAAAGGFAHASAMSSALQPIIAATPLQLASTGRIGVVLDRFAEELSRRAVG